MTDKLMEKLDKIDLSDKTNRMALTAFAAYGALYLGSWAWTVTKGFMKYCVLPRKNLKSRYGECWALVTGASDGLGKSYANELAKSGIDVILMARSQEKTQKVADEIAKQHNVKTKVITYDFANLSSEESINDLKALLEKETEGLDVGILVNNVGCTKFGAFDTQTWEDHMRQVNVNINSQTYMSLFLVPKMLERKSKSAIINVSSVAHFYPMGSLAMYCATKSYNYVFSKNLALNYPKKIDVLTVTPAGTKTQMYSGRYSFSVSAEDHGKAVIDQLGW